MRSLYIIDAIGFLFRSFFAIRGMKAPDGTPTNALFGFIRSIDKLFHDFPIEHCVAVFDGPNNKASRTKIYPDYKGHRSQMPDELAIQLELAHRFTELYGLPLLSIANVEADDVIGSLAHLATQSGYHVHIISQDKDLCQLVGNGIDLIQPHKENLLINASKVKEIYSVRPDQIVDYLAIIGDSSDNIPGIKGFGPKAAVKLLEQFGSLKNLYAHLDEIENDKKRQQLFDAKETAFLSQQLATLDLSVPIPTDFSFYKKLPPQTDPLNRFYAQYGFRSLTKNEETAPQANFSKSTHKEKKTLIETATQLKDCLTALKKFSEICVDTETTSLNKMEAQIVGIGLGANREDLYYIPFNGSIDHEVLLSELNSFFSDETLAFYGHHLKYDLHALRNCGLFPKRICFDTMVASYVLHPENNRHNLDILSEEILNMKKTPITALIGEGKNQRCMDEVPIDQVKDYCLEDVSATIQLKNYFQPLLKEQHLETIFYDIDLPLLPILYEMERHGIYVGKDRLKALSHLLVDSIQHLEKKIFDLAGKPFNIKSPKQLSEILFVDLNIESKGKKKQTGFSTSADVLEELKEAHPIIAFVLEYRTLEKLRSTYVDALPHQIDEKTKRIHCTFNQSVTATGRLSCQDPNLQNIPVRSEIGTEIRSAFCPENPNWVFLSADYSQIELRILAHLSEDPTLIQAFNQDEDIHQLTASLIFECPLEQVTSKMRSQAKAVNFGIIYGQQAFGLSKEIGIPLKEASIFIKKYFERYPKVHAFLEQEKEKARESGYSLSLMGRRRKLDEIQSKNPMIRAQAERYAVNTPIQGTQSDLIKLAMIQITALMKAKKLKSYLILQIHDELIFEVDPEEIEAVQTIVKTTMETIYPMKVPLKVNISIGKNWGEC